MKQTLCDVCNEVIPPKCDPHHEQFAVDITLARPREGVTIQEASARVVVTLNSQMDLCSVHASHAAVAAVKMMFPSADWPRVDDRFVLRPDKG